MLCFLFCGEKFPLRKSMCSKTHEMNPTKKQRDWILIKFQSVVFQHEFQYTGLQIWTSLEKNSWHAVHLDYLLQAPPRLPIVLWKISSFFQIHQTSYSASEWVKKNTTNFSTHLQVTQRLSKHPRAAAPGGKVNLPSQRGSTWLVKVGDLVVRR